MWGVSAGRGNKGLKSVEQKGMFTCIPKRYALFLVVKTTLPRDLKMRMWGRWRGAHNEGLQISMERIFDIRCA